MKVAFKSSHSIHSLPYEKYTAHAVQGQYYVTFGNRASSSSLYWQALCAMYIHCRCLHAYPLEIVQTNLCYVYTYHRSTKQYQKVSQVCCCLYFQVRSTSSNANGNKHWIFLSGIAWYMVIVILSYEPLISLHDQMQRA